MAVTMIGLRPMVHAQINGTDALFIADSGAFYSALTRAAADEFKLPLASLPFGFVMKGVGGEAQAWLTHVTTFTLLDVPLRNTEFIVVGNELGSGAVGLLGQNVFRIFGDVEYDLANGVIRLVKTKDCRDSPMAYWAKSQPYSVIDIDYATPAVAAHHQRRIPQWREDPRYVRHRCGHLAADAARLRNAPASPPTATASSPPGRRMASGGGW